MEPIVTAASRPSIRLVGVPPAHYLALAGKGPLEGAGKAAEVLLRVGEAIRARHAAAGRNFTLALPELLVWEAGHWEVLQRVPEVVRPGEITAARKAFHERQRLESRGVALIRLEEGACLEGTVEGRSGSGISAALKERARELGMELLQPRHEMRTAHGPLVVRQRLLLREAPPSLTRAHTRIRRRARGLPGSWKRRLFN